MRPANEAFEYYPIGIIHAPHAVPRETPIQQGARGGWTELVNDEQARQRGAREFKKGNP